MISDAPPHPSSGASELRQRFEQLALNLWWTWQPEVIELFRAVDADVWREANHNPIALLHRYGGDELDRRIDALALRSRVDFWYRHLQEYLTSEETWCAARSGPLAAAMIAYFSTEFGIHESLPLYSGGLGTLAGDYLKSASELGLPVVGVGLFYANGYFHQHVDGTGWQREEYGKTDISALPLVHAAAADGSALTVDVQCGNNTIHAGVWLAHVGRTRLLLIDSDLPANLPPLRELTARLVRHSRTRGGAGPLRPRPAWFAPPVDPPDETVDRDARLAVQRRPDGRRLRQRLLHSDSWGPVSAKTRMSMDAHPSTDCPGPLTRRARSDPPGAADQSGRRSDA